MGSYEAIWSKAIPNFGCYGVDGVPIDDAWV